MIDGEADRRLDAAIGAQIRISRRHLGLSQAELAETLGVTFQQIQNYERGAEPLTAGLLHRLAGALGVSVGALFDSEQSGPKSGSVPDLISQPGAQAALEAFLAIADPTVRRNFVALMRSVGPERHAEVSYLAPVLSQDDETD